MEMIKRWTGLILVLAILLCMGGTAMAAGEYTYVNGILEVHGGTLSGTTLYAALKSIAGDAQRSDYGFKLANSDGSNSVTKILNSDNELLGSAKSFTFTDNEEYAVYKTIVQTGTMGGFLPLYDYAEDADATFGVCVYDNLTINTVKDNVTTTEIKKVCRSEGYTVEVPNYDGYKVEVKNNTTNEVLTNYNVTLTADTTVTITYTKNTDSTVQLGNANGATVQIGSSVLGGATPVTANSTVNLTVTAPTNRYVKSVEVTEGTSAVTLTGNTYTNGQFACAFTAGEKKTYTVNVVTEDVIQLTTAPYSVNLDGASQQLAQLVTNYNALADAGTVQFQYLAGIVLGSEKWETLDYVPSTSESLVYHAFGDNATEKVKVIFVTGSGMYPNASTTIDVTVVRAKSTIALDAQSSSDARVMLGLNTLTAGSGVEVNQGEEQTVSILPTADNCYISAITISDGASIVATQNSVTPTLGTYTFKLTPDKSNYTIKVTTAPIFGTTEIRYTASLTDDDIKSRIIAAYGNSVPSIAAVSFTRPQNSTATSTTATITYTNSTGRYPAAGTADVTVNLDWYDILTVRVEGADASTNTIEVNRGEDAAFIVASKADYNVEVVKVLADGVETLGTEAGTYNLGKLSGDVTVKVTYTLETDSTVKTGNVSNATVSVMAGDQKETLTAAGKTLAANTAMTLSATPAEGYYVSAVTVTDQAGNPVSLTNAAYQNGVYSFTFTSGATKNAYVVDVETAPVALKLKNGDADQQTIAYNTQQNISVAAAALRALIDAEGSVPSTNGDGTLTIEYQAGNTDYTSKWAALDYAPTGTDLILYHAFGENQLNQGKETIRVTFQSSDPKYPATTRTFTVTFTDPRVATTIVVKDPQDAITYAVNPDVDAIIDAISDGVVVSSTGEQIEGAQIELQWNPLEQAINTHANAGSHTVTLSYAGDSDNYGAATATVTFTIDRAPATIDVASTVINWTGNQIADPITVTAAAPNTGDKVSYITVVAGLDINGKAYINANLPQTGNSAIDAGISAVIGNGKTVSLSEVSSLLNTLLSSTDLNSDVIDGLEQLIDEIAALEMMDDATITISYGKNIMPSDSGVYLIGGVISDTNYKTTADLNYAVIKPNAAEGKLVFNFQDDNYVVLLSSLSEYDFGVHMAEDGLTQAQIDWASDHIESLYIGVTTSGDTVFGHEVPTSTGAYTQIAYINGVANDNMVYAAPIVRAFVIVEEPVDVRFTTEDRTFTYDGKKHGLDAAAYSFTTGKDITSEGKLTVYYSGVETDGDLYAPSTTRPTECGTYNVTATFVSDDQTKAGIATTTMLITLSDEAKINVANKNHIYDGTSISVSSLVTSTPDNNARTIISGGVSVDVELDNENLNVLTGVINVDFPKRVDNLLDRYIKDRDVTAGALLSAIDTVLDTVSDQLDAELLATVRDIIKQLSTDAKLTFYDDPAYSDIGMYLVFGAITDPNYKVDADVGYLTIAADTATIDVINKTHVYNGESISINSLVTSTPGDAARTVITGAVYEDVDLDSANLNALSGSVNVDFPKKVDNLLDNYIKDRDVTTGVLLNAIDSALAAVSKQVDSELLTDIRDMIKQLPADVVITFHDNPSYSEVGTYLVFAAITDPYYTVDTDVGYLVITPASATIEVQDKTHVYDGSSVSVNSMVTKAPSDAAHTVISGSITVTGNLDNEGLEALNSVVNVDFPASVDTLLDKVIKDRDMTVGTLINSLDSLLAQINDQLDSELIQSVRDVLADLPADVKLTFYDNASYSEVGAYLVYAVITDPSYKVVTDAGYLNITPVAYTITVNETANGVVRADKTTAGAGETVTLTVIPDAGYELDTLVVTAEDGTTVVVTDNTFTMPASNVTVTATFKATTAATYTVTVVNGSGSGEYAEGMPVTVTANAPAAHQKFVNWTGLEGLTITLGSADTQSLTFTMPAHDVTLTANYEEIPGVVYTVSFNANGGSGTMDAVAVSANTAYTLPENGFTAPLGYQFVGWALSTDGEIITSPYTVTADTVFYAIWEAIPAGNAPVIVTPTANQTVTVTEGKQATMTITATGATSYQWYVNRNDGLGYVAISGAVEATYTTSIVALNNDGYTYYCVASNQYGSATSPTFTLNVLKSVVLPETGDDFSMQLWCAIALFSCCGLMMLMRRKAR